MKKIHNFLEGAVFDEVIDVVTKITKNSFLSLNITQARFIGDDSCESLGVFRFLRHGLLVLGNFYQLDQVERGLFM